MNPAQDWGVTNNVTIDFIAFIRPYETLRTFVRFDRALTNPDQPAIIGTRSVVVNSTMRCKDSTFNDEGKTSSASARSRVKVANASAYS